MDQETYRRALMTEELEVQGIEQVVLAQWQIEVQAVEEIEHKLGLELLHVVVDVLQHVRDVQSLVTVIVLLQLARVIAKQ